MRSWRFFCLLLFSFQLLDEKEMVGKGTRGEVSEKNLLYSTLEISKTLLPVFVKG